MARSCPFGPAFLHRKISPGATPAASVAACDQHAPNVAAPASKRVAPGYDRDRWSGRAVSV